MPCPLYPLMALKTHMSFIPYSQPITVAATKDVCSSLKCILSHPPSNSNPRTFRLEPCLLWVQRFSASALLTFGTESFSLGGCPVRCRGHSTISGLYPLDTCSTNHCPSPTSCDNQNVPWGAKLPQLRSTALVR